MCRDADLAQDLVQDALVRCHELVVTTPSDGGWDRDALDRFVRAIVLP